MKKHRIKLKCCRGNIEDTQDKINDISNTIHFMLNEYGDGFSIQNIRAEYKKGIRDRHECSSLARYISIACKSMGLKRNGKRYYISIEEK